MGEARNQSSWNKEKTSPFSLDIQPNNPVKISFFVMKINWK